MPSEIPPPIYSQQDPDVQSICHSEESFDPQLLIVPTVNAVSFQQGYLGADGERAAIEGEVQIKGQEAGRWSKVTVSLRTIESAYDSEVELSFLEIVVFESSSMECSVPSTLQFSIPLAPDVPQSLRTPQSSLSHVLVAMLHPSEPGRPSLSKSVLVQTRRFISHSYSPAVHPETHALDAPTRIEVQVPRTTFIAGETIPLYVTIPPPTRDLVLERGLRLRNVKAELIQSITVNRLEIEDFEQPVLARHDDYSDTSAPTGDWPPLTPTTPMGEKRSAFASSSRDGNASPSNGASYQTTVAHSGASCRFHTRRPIRLRFLLHMPSPIDYSSPMDLPNAESAHLDGDVHFTPITQATLLHSVTFRLNAHVSFVDTSAHMERISTISIPIVMIAPPAPLPEVDDSLEVAYQKKHDRPPAQTVRYDDAESSAPRYEAGPSFLNGLPPPFEERDAPPPFFSHTAESSHSAGLPTFLESEAEIIVPQGEQARSMLQPPQPPIIVGEGQLFGFASSEEFDGHVDDTRLATSPPPTLDISPLDADAMDLASIDRQEHTLEALAVTLEDHREADDDQPPPPPPAMDDPSDPPPSIDSEFRSPTALAQSPTPHSSVPPLVSASNISPQAPAPSNSQVSSENHAPPPYLRHDRGQGQEHVTRPPPYMDLMPAVLE